MFSDQLTADAFKKLELRIKGVNSGAEHMLHSEAVALKSEIERLQRENYLLRNERDNLEENINRDCDPRDETIPHEACICRTCDQARWHIVCRDRPAHEPSGGIPVPGVSADDVAEAFKEPVTCLPLREYEALVADRDQWRGRASQLSDELEEAHGTIAHQGKQLAGVAEPPSASHAIDALKPFVALYETIDARYRKRGGNPDLFSDTHPFSNIDAADLPMGVWRRAQAALRAPEPSRCHCGAQEWPPNCVQIEDSHSRLHTLRGCQPGAPLTKVASHD